MCIYPSKKRFRLENKGFLAVYISQFFVDKRWKVVVDKWKVFHKGKILYILLFIYACIREYKKRRKKLSTINVDNLSLVENVFFKICGKLFPM